jgi:hypothetical protein
VALARSTDFADALAGTPLAVDLDAPVLLTAPTSLDQRVLAEIQRILPAGGTVHLLGGTAALSAEVEDAIKAAGYQTVRVAGATRIETSIAIAELLEPSTVLIATGFDFPDALAAGAAAAAHDAAVLLTTSEQPHPALDAYLAGAVRPGRVRGRRTSRPRVPGGESRCSADPRAHRGGDRRALLRRALRSSVSRVVTPTPTRWPAGRTSAGSVGRCC